jgi:hypothetical protein
MRVCACAGVYACVNVRGRGCVCVRAGVYVCARMCTCARGCVCVRAGVCVRVCERERERQHRNQSDSDIGVRSQVGEHMCLTDGWLQVFAQDSLPSDPTL